MAKQRAEVKAYELKVSVEEITATICQTNTIILKQKPIGLQIIIKLEASAWKRECIKTSINIQGQSNLPSPITLSSSFKSAKAE